ncbi:hypothetical protein QR98_0058660 [Sarcoptes scabiei]|uniref:Uncharacterized protein n=1 Tax=Sarcoptes scabiei TaxID=52283 RepID=A0A132A8U2_SARSC|nr:hypothetical protein QR98_0058660 [Sarcoptes scabiei]
MPQLIIGANLIKNPKAKPLTINLPPPPSISFGDSGGNKYGGGWWWRSQVSQVVRPFQDYRAHQGHSESPHPGYPAVQGPQPIPVPNLHHQHYPQYHHQSHTAPSYLPPPTQAESYPNVMAVPPPPSPSYVHPPMPYYPQPPSSPSNPIQSYPIQQHYYPYHHPSESVPQPYQAPPPSESSPGEAPIDVGFKSSLQAESYPMSQPMPVPPESVYALPPPADPNYHMPKMSHKSPFHLVKDANEEHHKLRLKPNELYSSEEASAAYESANNDQVAEDLAKDYGAAPRISIHRFTRQQ